MIEANDDIDDRWQKAKHRQKHRWYQHTVDDTTTIDTTTYTDTTNVDTITVDETDSVDTPAVLRGVETLGWMSRRSEAGKIKFLTAIKGKTKRDRARNTVIYTINTGIYSIRVRNTGI